MVVKVLLQDRYTFLPLPRCERQERGREGMWESDMSRTDRTTGGRESGNGERKGGGKESKKELHCLVLI